MRRASLIATVAAMAVAVAADAAAGTGPRAEPLANHCFVLHATDNGRFVAAAGTGYAATSGRAGAMPLFLEPTGLGRYLLYDRDRRFLSLAAGGPDARGYLRVERADAPGSAGEWTPMRERGGTFSLTSTPAGRSLTAIPDSGALAVTSSGPERVTSFRLERAGGCVTFPEATPAARGKPFQGMRPDGSLAGFVDAHVHITADLRAGGRVIHGETFDPFGIGEALGHDEDDHGADGSADVTGNLLRTGLPFGTHDTHGWPTFAGWPVHDTNTHQQVYYVWLKRAWKAGLRLAVAQTVEDEPMCEIEPVRSHSCDETQTIKLEVERLRALEDYVDAQSGGPGRGWFRVVDGPGQARRAIEDGKLAVVLGVESSNPFGCSELNDEPQCTRADVDRGIRRFRRWGIRSMFVAHWVDNAFSGAALEGGDKGTFINVFERHQTGHWFRTGPCPDPSQGEEVTTLAPFELEVLASFFPATSEIAAEGMPSYPPGKQCNSKGLTKLGRYLIRRLMDAHMLIEVDHMSERARDRVLKIARRHDYPLVSSHTGTGGSWTPAELRRLYASGGLATATPDAAPELGAKIRSFSRYRTGDHYFGVGLGTDTGGFSSLPGPPEDAAANPLVYPFRSHDGDVRFDRQRTGERTFDYNVDGVAHYGLFPDLLADMERRQGGERAMRDLFRSAEAYLEMWGETRGRH
jgi:microsomal dipeptidase-like Zn-dependent dipeptidase